jgi:predicted amidohydrolase
MTPLDDPRLILVLDAGTTYVKAFLFNHRGALVGETRKRTSYIMEEPGQVEHLSFWPGTTSPPPTSPPWGSQPSAPPSSSGTKRRGSLSAG